MLDHILTHIHSPREEEIEDTPHQHKELHVWIQKAKAGDSEIFGCIYDHFIKDIYRYVFFKVSEEDASDVTADIFIKAWEKIHTFKSEDTSKFRSWLFTIAHRTIIDYYRVRKITVTLDDALEIPSEEEDIDSPEGEMEHLLSEDILQTALQKLPEPGKSVINMKFLQDLSYGEISEILKIKEGNVRIIVHRSLKRLKEVLLELKEAL